ncbi:deoxyribodipyrimidine photolyase-related protein [Fadolivirus algeromassiliense]|jgi:deoxyribodipyrimidine photolyase-related protein|uniref:Deoxyribodipyrimidine photolyase-related protein n=1 Tax=Fadolivirus FV1/VV64 TaxID=3070911 RepID=A0A7D3UVQ6_9VIRU|nr:deoxyribodipyrimidine photolyase-related protein [Fadolivirus algeromassiliense]QKF94369.1 deoxyribodipyrimidine photolyase-related protein [Fadolivirus FV1/VV64]
MNTIIILPNQLFEDNGLINKNTTVYLYEHPVYFTKYKFHKLKLILHRATMKNYEDYLKKTYKCKVNYIEFNDNINSVFKKYKNKRIDMYDPVDHDVMKDLKKLSKQNSIELFVHDTPLFLCKITDLTDYLDSGGKYHQTSFYIWQRKRLSILVTRDNKPIGGKWTFDKENRLPFPKQFNKDAKFDIINNKYITEAQYYIDKHFKDNIGETDLYLPINHEGAKKQLKKFLKQRLDCFGPYQDAVSRDIVFGCHTVLSPLINIGLITPREVIDEILNHYSKNKKTLKSVEALIRQIIGWREMIRLVYMFQHRDMETTNYFNHKRKLDAGWYTGNTNIEPIDDIIKKILKYGYAHHIERLMYLGNFMLLNQINPDKVFEWFMEMFIDSYQWVMQANVYAMSQYSTGSLLMTRPYFSSSNYIDKMSSYNTVKNKYQQIKLGNEEYEWYEVWDALYYNFINLNKTEFSKNYAIASAVGHWNRKSKHEKDRLLDISKKWFAKY